MNRFSCVIMLFFGCTVLSGCTFFSEKNKTSLEPQVIEKIRTVKVPSEPIEVQAKKTHKLGIIGEVEPVYFLPMKKAMLSRIDTGAETSSIDAQNIQLFEREGVKWVSFDVENKRNGEKYHFEKRLYRHLTIKRQNESEDRYVVLMTIQMGNEKITAQFSLADRSKFNYQGLIGRNVLQGRAIVDTALSKTLY